MVHDAHDADLPGAPTTGSHAGALWRGAFHGIPEPIRRALADGAAALEVGCGTGLGCLALAESVPGARVVGHDVDAAAIAQAHTLARAARLEPRVSFAVDDSTRLPHARFVLITAEDVRARNREPACVLNAIRNALEPAGVCLAFEPTTDRVARLELLALARGAGFSRVRRVPAEAPFGLYELRR